MSSGSDYAFSMPKVLRPRHEFPTPLFRLAIPLLLAVGVALELWLGR